MLETFRAVIGGVIVWTAVSVILFALLMVFKRGELTLREKVERNAIEASIAAAGISIWLVFAHILTEVF